MNVKSAEMTLWLKGFAFAAMLARKPGLTPLIRRLMRLAAWYSLTMKRGQPKTSLREVVDEWQRMFPSQATGSCLNPIREITDNTVYADTHNYIFAYS